LIIIYPMRKGQLILAAVIFVLCLSPQAGAGTVRKLKADKDISRQDVELAMTVKREFLTHKRMIFKIAWNGIPVGRVIAKSDETIEYGGRKAYVVKVVTESNEFISKIYRVEDTYTSYVDAETMTSLRYEADRKEGRYRKHAVVEYDFPKKEAVCTNLRDGSVKRCAINDQVHDPVSAFCYFMTLPVNQGEKMYISVNLNEKNYDIYGTAEDIGVVKLPRLGEFPAFMIRPYVYLKNEEYRRGKAWMYFAAGEKRYPLYGVVSIIFGKVTATLDSVEDI
jgi:hypothetical protein